MNPSRRLALHAVFLLTLAPLAATAQTFLGAGPGGRAALPLGPGDPATVAFLTQKTGQPIPDPGVTLRQVVRDPQGRFLVAGDFDRRDPATGLRRRGLLRLLPDGRLDPTFPQLPLPGPVTAVGVQREGANAGKLVVACEVRVADAPRGQLLRFHPDGTPDPTFNPPPPGTDIFNHITAPVLCLTVEPDRDRLYVGLNNGFICSRRNFGCLTPNGPYEAAWRRRLSTDPFPGQLGPVRDCLFVRHLFGFNLSVVVVVGDFLATVNATTTHSMGGMCAYQIGRGSVSPGFGAGLDASLALWWGYPAANGFIRAVACDPESRAPQRVYLAGDFTLFNNQPRPGLAAIVIREFSNAVEPFNPNPALLPDRLSALARVGDRLVVAGRAAPQRPTIAAFQVETSQPTNPPLPPTFAGLTVPDEPTAVRRLLPTPQGLLAFGGPFAPTGGPFAAEFPIPDFPTFTLPDRAGVRALARAPSGETFLAGDLTRVRHDPDTGRATLAETCLLRRAPDGALAVVAAFRNLPGYLVRNDRDTGQGVPPTQDINAAPNSGFRRVDDPGEPVICALARDAQGRLYVGGRFNRVVVNNVELPWTNLARFTPDGALDQSFNAGALDSLVPGYPTIRRGGPTGFGQDGNGLLTCDPDATAPRWNGQSWTPAPEGTGTKFDPALGTVRAVLVQADGRIVIGGDFKAYDGQPRGGAARLLPTGAPDPSFADPDLRDYPAVAPVVPRSPAPESGESLPDYLDRLPQARALARRRAAARALLPDGDGLLVGGSFAGGNAPDGFRPRLNLARLTAFGRLDAAFGSDFAGASGLGDAYTDEFGAGRPNQGASANGRDGDVAALARQGGEVLLAGRFIRLVGQGDPLARAGVARLLPAGAPDPTFNPPGLAGDLRAALPQADGRLVIGGDFLLGPRDQSPGDGRGFVPNQTRARLARLLPTGALDPTFLAVPPGGTLMPPGPYLDGEFSPAGTAAPAFAPTFPTPGAGVRALLDAGDGALLVGGSFHRWVSLEGDLVQRDGEPTGGLARVHTGCVLALLNPGSGPDWTPFAPPSTLNAGPGGATLPLAVVARSASGGCGGLVPPLTTNAPWLTVTVETRAAPAGWGDLRLAVAPNPGPARSGTVTIAGQTIAVAQGGGGDPPPTRAATIGMFRPTNGFFYLRFTNTAGFADTDFFYGLAGDAPLSGDWNGDGVETIGVFRQGQFFLRNSNTAGFADLPVIVIAGTQPGDIPLAGDWDGDGTATVGLFRQGTFLLRNSLTSGPPDTVVTFGAAGDVPVTGDWDGDGRATIGVFRQGSFFLRNSNAPGPPDVAASFGAAGDTPLAGDWNGDGRATIGVFRVTGQNAQFFLVNENVSAPLPPPINYGLVSDRPIVGKWR